MWVRWKCSRLTSSHDLSHAVGLQAKAVAAILEMVVLPAFGCEGWTGDIVTCSDHQLVSVFD